MGQVALAREGATSTAGGAGTARKAGALTAFGPGRVDGATKLVERAVAAEVGGAGGGANVFAGAGMS